MAREDEQPSRLTGLQGCSLTDIAAFPSPIHVFGGGSIDDRPTRVAIHHIKEPQANLD